MKSILAVASLLLLIIASPAEARHRHHYRHLPRVATQAVPECAYDNSGRVQCLMSAKRTESVPIEKHSPAPRKISIRTERLTYQSEGVVSHPKGCPWRQFCACGVSMKIWGYAKHMAAAAFFKYPRANPAPGMVAVRSHHVMYIERVLDGNGNAAVVYDPNSGGHQTRVHVRSLAGYRIVNPT